MLPGDVRRQQWQHALAARGADGDRLMDFQCERIAQLTDGSAGQRLARALRVTCLGARSAAPVRAAFALRLGPQLFPRREQVLLVAIGLASVRLCLQVLHYDPKGRCGRRHALAAKPVAQRRGSQPTRWILLRALPGERCVGRSARVLMQRAQRVRQPLRRGALPRRCRLH